MTDSKLRTPDGRVIRAAAGDETVAAYPDEEGVRAMKPFFDACQAVLSDRPVSAGGRLGLFLFQLGAADRFWHRHNLDDHRFPAFAAQLLQSQAGVGASEAVAISTALPQLRGVAAANAVIAEGPRS